MTATGTGGGQWRWPTFFIQTRSVPFVSPDSSHQPRSSGRLSDLWWQVLFLGDLFPFRFKQALNLSHWVGEFVTFIPRTRFRCYARAHFFGLWGFALLLRPTTFFFGLFTSFCWYFLFFSKSTKKTHEQGPEVAVKCTGKMGIFLPGGGGDE